MVDETSYGEDKKPLKQMGIRNAVLAAWEVPQALDRIRSKSLVRRMTSLGLILRYAMQFRMCSPRKQVYIVKIDELVEQWLEAVVGMSTCHDKDDFDANDAKADELMGPLLTAPVKQVREFYEKLQARMREDKRVPMVVWMGFEAWGEIQVKNAPDQGIIRLKNKLAEEIANIVEEDVRGQIPKAIARALRWRDAETLKEVKEVLESGAKPKLVGRQSCLFLECGKGDKKVCVML